MDKKKNSRLYLLVLVAVVVLFVSAAGIVAFAQSDSGAVFTGCLNPSSGLLRNVAIGYETAKACNEEEEQITWDWAGPAFDDRIAALEERVDELEEPFGTLELFVDCDVGDTVSDALADAQTHAGPMHISITGVCEENVSIDRDDVYISGLERSDGIRSADPAVSAVIIDGAQGVRFSNMTISAGIRGIWARGGAVFTAEDVTVRDTIFGITVQRGSNARLVECSIVDNIGDGIKATNGGSARISNCFLSGNGLGVNAEYGSTAWVIDSTITAGGGVQASFGGALWIRGSNIVENEGWDTVGCFSNSSVHLLDSLVANNSNIGVFASTNSTVVIEDTVIENNGSHGSSAYSSSIVNVNNATIRNNGGSGIFITDFSLGNGAGAEIHDNDGWGIECSGPDAIMEAQYGFEGEMSFSDNTNGDTNCP